MSQSTPSAIVVGAGVAGLCTAWSLSRRGAAVTVVERGSVPDPHAASCDHHRMIRLSYADPGYCARMPAAYDAWAALWADLPGPETRYHHDRGVLTLSEGNDGSAAALRSMQAAGHPLEMLEPGEIAVRFPHVEPSNIAFGFLSRGGCLMANHILTDLADRLRARGVSILEQSRVASVDAAAGAATLADGRRLEADAVVISAGVGAKALVPELAPDLYAWRTLVLYADPPAELAGAWASAPCWTDLGGEKELWGLPPVDGLPLKLGCGSMGRANPAPDDRVMTADEMRRMLAAYRGRWKRIEDFRIRWGQANHYLAEPGARFVLRREGKLWLVSADSGHGFKFGALTGEDVAQAVTGEVPEAEVARRMAALAA